VLPRQDALAAPEQRGAAFAAGREGLRVGVGVGGGSGSVGFGEVEGTITPAA